MRRPRSNPPRADAYKKWTRTQRIGTFAEIPIEAVILDTNAPPVHQQIAPEAFQFQKVGMYRLAIAKRLGVTDKIIVKAVERLFRMLHPRHS